MTEPIFSADWFSQNIPALTEVLAKFKGQQDIHALEIGCFEGRGTLWMLDNILTGESNEIDCVDTFKGSSEHAHFALPFTKVYEQFQENIKTHSGKSRILCWPQESFRMLRCLNLDYFHIIYVDGSHMAPDVLTDMVLSWPLLKQGGIMFCDDYDWPGTDGIEIHRPKVAIDAFMSIFSEQLKVIHQGYSVAVEKL